MLIGECASVLKQTYWRVTRARRRHLRLIQERVHHFEDGGYLTAGKACASTVGFRKLIDHQPRVFVLADTSMLTTTPPIPMADRYSWGRGHLLRRTMLTRGWHN